MLFTRNLILFLIGGCGLFALRWVYPPLEWIGWAYDGFLLFCLLLDFRLTPNPGLLTATREVSETGAFGDDKLSLGADNRISIHLRNRGKLPLQVVVKDEPPATFSVPSRTLPVRIPANGEASVSYSVRPSHRGNYRFGNINLRYTGALGLMMRQAQIPAAEEVKVYPNLHEIRKYDLLARRGRLQQLGIRAAVLRGRGTEFESLRDYHHDDEFRQIHWKASARRGKLISVQHQVERSQNILVALDCGRMMAAEVNDASFPGGEGLSKLDHAINAALMISYVASVMDDKVGLLAFSDAVQCYLPPRKGRRQVYRIMESLYGLESELIEPDYQVAFSHLRTHSNRRTLVILFTDLVDAEVSKEMLIHLSAIRPAHLPMCVTINSGDILEMAAKVPHESREVYEKAMAVHVLKQREEALRALRSRGVYVVDVAASHLSVAVINKYLELKARVLL